MANSSQNQAQYLYKIGDYVYFETSANQPYQIRRIEELQKLSNNQVEAKVTCFFRRRDLSSQLLQLADKHHSSDGTLSQFGSKPTETASGDETAGAVQNGAGTPNAGENVLTPKQRHQLKHRELFMSRQVETLSATLIRGKCNVTLLNETESPSSYIQRTDAFYYRLVYDPDVKTLLADRGEIRVGPKYQVASSQLSEPVISRSSESTDDIKPSINERDASCRETPLWINDRIDDRQVEQFVTIVKSVGAYARALDLHSAAKNTSLQLSAAVASRDITSQTALNILHETGYKVEEALSRLVPATGPLLCRDEMEGWSANDVQLFETALEKCGKNFSFIRSAYLPWKSMRSVIEYYYFWKTTDRYVHQRRSKALEAARKLTAFYVAPFNKPSPALLPTGHALNVTNAKPCESCCTQNGVQWYAFGPAQQTRICASCWSYWKRYGGLKLPTRLDGERPTPRGRQERIAEMLSSTKTSTGPSSNPPALGTSHVSPVRAVKQRGDSTKQPVAADLSDAAQRGGAGSLRANFCMQATPLGRLARILCHASVHTRQLARAPTRAAVSAATVKQSLATHLDALTEADRTCLIDAARERERDRHARAVLAVREMMRSHPYYRNTPADSNACRTPTDSAGADAPLHTKTVSLDSATKRCTKSSPVKCAQGANGNQTINGASPMDFSDGTGSQPSAITISRRSASKLNALNAHAAGAPAGVAKQTGVANGADEDDLPAAGTNGAAGAHAMSKPDDDLRVGVSTTGITRKRVRDSLASPNESISPGCNRSLDADADSGAKRPRSDLQLLITKTDRGVNLRLTATSADACSNDVSAHTVLAKYRECIELVNEHERVVWEPSWYMLAMPLVRRARSKCVSAQQLRRLGRKWTQHAFELKPPASGAAKPARNDAQPDATSAKQNDAKWDANEHEPARLTMLYD